MPTPLPTRAGNRYPPGATLAADGVNFSLFSRHATGVELLLYEAADSARPFQVIALDPESNCTHMMWHVFVAGLAAGAHYAWRVDGPADTATTGRRFNPRKELVDPWARGVTAALWDRRRAADPADTGPCAVRGVVCEPAFDWSGERPVARDLDKRVDYTGHLRGCLLHFLIDFVTVASDFVGVAEKFSVRDDRGQNVAQIVRDGTCCATQCRHTFGFQFFAL